MKNSPPEPDLPTTGGWFARMFAAYSERLLKRNFHSLRILGEPDLDRFNGRAVVIYANHPSWWDPIVGLVLWRKLLRGRNSYAPIDSRMLEKYSLFKRLGYFGVDKHSVAGIRRFLKTAVSLLKRPDTVMFFTPQGRFADVREADPGFEPGLSHLAANAGEAVFLPMAIEFTYWEEKRPEILIRFGDPLTLTGTHSPKKINPILEARLNEARKRLATASMDREVDAFQNLLVGREGTNAIYDAWRRLKALLKGQPFTPAHGNK